MTGPVLSRPQSSPRAVARPHVSVSAASAAPDHLTEPTTDHDRGPDGVRAGIARAGPALTVVSLAGAVDLDSVHVLAAALAGAVSTSGVGGRVVLELDRVSFLGVCGLGVILAAHADTSRRGGAVVLVVDEVAPAARLLSLLIPGCGPATYPTLSSALAAARAARVAAGVAT